MRNAWRDFLSRLSGPHGSFSSAAVARWKPADFEALRDLGLLVAANHWPSDILCPECSGHWAEVKRPEEGARAVVFCEREGRPVDVDPEQLVQWEPDKERFVTLLAASLGIAEGILPLLAGQLWRLGRCRVALRQRDMFFAAAAPDDHPSVLAEIRRGYGAIAGLLLLPSSAPHLGHDSRLRIVDLASATALESDGIALDVAFIEEQFAQDVPIRTGANRKTSVQSALRAHRLKILKAFKKDNNLDRMEAVARRLGTSSTALYGMTRGDRSRYDDDKLESVLKQINCSRAKWNRPAKPAPHV